MTSRALSVLVYGHSKAGKSHLSTTAPYPRLLLDVESASRFLLHLNKIEWDPLTEPPPVADGSWDTCVVNVHKFEVAKKAYEWLLSGKHQFRSVIVDSISELQVKAQEHVNGRSQMQIQHWGQLLAEIGFLARDLRDLTTNRINPLEAVVITATLISEEGIQKPYLQGKIASQLPYFFDVCGYLYIDQEVDSEGQPSEVRRLFVGNNPNFETGNRVPGLDPILTNPNIENLIEQVFGPRPE